MRFRLAGWAVCLAALLAPAVGRGADAGTDTGGAAAAEGPRRVDLPLGGGSVDGPRIVRETPGDSWYGVSDPLAISQIADDPLGNAQSLAWSSIWDNYYRDAQRRYERYEARRGGDYRHHGAVSGGFIPAHIEFGVVSADGFRRTGVVDASSGPGGGPAGGLTTQPPTLLARPSSLSFAAAVPTPAESPVAAALSKVPDVQPAASRSAARPRVPPPPVAHPPVSPAVASSAGGAAPASAASSPREQALALMQKLLSQRESAAGLQRTGVHETDAAAAEALLPLPERQRAMAARVTAKIAARKPISVTVQGDTATLRGSVASAHDRIVAEVMLRLEPGIRQVDNQLTVAP